ncbi:MAG: hypothetical protein K0Q51_757 [Rickettsiaceae bacterium]|jgi:ankyrin repeat protein|nr:hypothetical protein [Rickettsiaceae bacterium]
MKSNENSATSNQKANINARNMQGMTPLMVSARGGDYKTAIELIRNGADRNATTAAGHSAAYYAAKCERMFLSEMVENKENPNINAWINQGPARIKEAREVFPAIDKIPMITNIDAANNIVRKVFEAKLDEVNPSTGEVKNFQEKKMQAIETIYSITSTKLHKDLDKELSNLVKVAKKNEKAASLASNFSKSIDRKWENLKIIAGHIGKKITSIHPIEKASKSKEKPIKKGRSGFKL